MSERQIQKRLVYGLRGDVIGDRLRYNGRMSLIR
jgi:hypothetical protein